MTSQVGRGNTSQRVFLIHPPRAAGLEFGRGPGPVTANVMPGDASPGPMYMVSLTGCWPGRWQVVGCWRSVSQKVDSDGVTLAEPATFGHGRRRTTTPSLRPLDEGLSCSKGTSRSQGPTGRLSGSWGLASPCLAGLDLGGGSDQGNCLEGEKIGKRGGRSAALLGTNLQIAAKKRPKAGEGERGGFDQDSDLG